MSWMLELKAASETAFVFELATALEIAEMGVVGRPVGIELHEVAAVRPLQR